MSAITSPLRLTTPKMLAVAGVTLAGLAMTSGGVYSALNATTANPAGHQITSGALSLTLTPNGAGFTSAVSNLAPGDIVNRYVDLTQGQALDAKNLTLSVADSTSPATRLSTDTVNGLHVTVNECVGGTWSATDGSCTGTAVALISNAPLSAVNGTGLAVASTAKSSTTHLQVSVALPDQTETTVNGALPASSIQNLAASLTWTFSETQRTATTTNH